MKNLAIIIVLGFALLTGCSTGKPLFYGKQKAIKQINNARTFYPSVHAASCETHYQRNDSTVSETYTTPGASIIVFTDTVYRDSGKVKVITKEVLKTDTVRKETVTYINNAAREARIQAECDENIANMESRLSEAVSKEKKAIADRDNELADKKYWRKKAYQGWVIVGSIFFILIVYIVAKVWKGFSLGGLLSKIKGK